MSDTGLKTSCLTASTLLSFPKLKCLGQLFIMCTGLCAVRVVTSALGKRPSDRDVKRKPHSLAAA